MYKPSDKLLLLQIVFKKQVIMKTETIKLGLIQRVMAVRKASVLNRMEKLMEQAEMEIRTEESLQAIEKGDILSLDEFRKENKKWVEKEGIK
jgi:hypothetical protein